MVKLYSFLTAVMPHILGICQLNAQVNVRVKHPTADRPLAETSLRIDLRKGYLIKDLGHKVYYVTDGVYQMMFIVTGKGVVAIDAPPSIGANILTAMHEVTDEPVTHVIYSHSHPDHIGAAHLYPSSALYITSEASAIELKRHNTAENMIAFGAFTGGQPVPVPSTSFKDSMTLSVGDKVIKLYSGAAPAHSGDDIIVFLPAERIAMLVDVVFPGWIPFEQIAYAVDIDGYLSRQQFLLTLDFDVLVAGHWGRPGKRIDVVNNVAYINDLLTALVQGFKTVDYASIAAKTNPENVNLLMETYFDAVAHYAAEKVESKWKPLLSGCDVWTYNHARRLIPFVRDSQVILRE